jgi:hypothetical protein
MRAILLLIITSFAWSGLYAGEDDLEYYFQRKRAIESKSMVALGTWSVSNLAIGTYQFVALPEGPDKYFHRMNLSWNLVNLPIAIWGFTRNARHKDMPDLATLRKQQKGVETALLVNSGLDVSYIAAGLVMNLKSSTSKNHDMLLGFGNSIMLQGTYLLVTDLVQYTIHRINRKRHFSQYKPVNLQSDF